MWLCRADSHFQLHQPQLFVCRPRISQVWKPSPTLTQHEVSLVLVSLVWDWSDFPFDDRLAPTCPSKTVQVSGHRSSDIILLLSLPSPKPHSNTLQMVSQNTLGIMEQQNPQEFILDVFADPASVRDVVRGMFATVFTSVQQPPSWIRKVPRSPSPYTHRNSKLHQRTPATCGAGR